MTRVGFVWRVRFAVAPLVRLDVDAAGDVTPAYAPTRPRRVGGRVVETPWGGRFGDHDVVGGVRNPTWAEVGWELPEGPFTYRRGRITSLDLR